MNAKRDRKDHDQATGELDPGAYIGREPEFESESIPGGVTDRDERVSAYDSQPGLPAEPDAQRDRVDPRSSGS